MTPIRYLSVCSGIEAASVAWHRSDPSRWQPVAFAQYDPEHDYSRGPDFPSRVLAERFPGVPNLGDMTTIETSKFGPVDLLVGGTPCQSFSIAGKRLSLADARGNLALAYTVLAHELHDNNGLSFSLWENVPGVLSTPDNAFGCFLSALVGGGDPLPLPRGFERWPDHGVVAGPRGRAAWRLLDAQWFGLAQRRERVFVVAGFGDDADPVPVLFERAGLPGDRPACVEERARAAARAARHPRPKSVWGAIAQGLRAWAGAGAAQAPAPLNDLGGVSHSLSAKASASGYMDASVETFIASALTASDGGVSGKDGGVPPIVGALGGTGPGGGWRIGVDEAMTGQVVPVIAGTLQSGGKTAGSATLQDAEQGQLVVVPVQEKTTLCFSSKDDGRDVTHDLAPTLRAMPHDKSHANAGGQLAVLCFDPTQITSPENRTNPRPGDPAPTLVKDMQSPPTIAFNLYPASGQGADLEASPTEVSSAVGAVTHGASTDRGVRICSDADVRRLTVVECERLQGFPDNWTLIPGSSRLRAPDDRAETVRYLMSHGLSAEDAEALADCPDGNRYRALGNSMAVPVMAWIGERIAEVHLEEGGP